MKKYPYRISDTCWKWALYFWRFIFWSAVVIFMILWFTKSIALQRKWELVIIIFLIYIVLIRPIFELLSRYIYKINKDLDDIKEHLGLELTPLKENKDYSLEFLNTEIEGGMEFEQIREDYINAYGFKRWITYGKYRLIKMLGEQNKDNYKSV